MIELILHNVNLNILDIKTLTLLLFEPECWNPLWLPFYIVYSLHQLMIGPLDVIVHDDQIKIMSVLFLHFARLVYYVNKLILLKIVGKIMIITSKFQSKEALNHAT